MNRALVALVCGLAAFNLLAAELPGEVVSYKCGLAIDAVLAELDTQANNLVTQEALSKITESNGEFICLPADDALIYIRLQASDIGPTENKLVFKVDTHTYQVLKTMYGP